MPLAPRMNHRNAVDVPLQPQRAVIDVESRLSMNFLNLISYFPQYSRYTETEIDLASLTR